MAIPTNIQSQIAFKNLLGKAQVNELASVVNEIDGYLLTVPSSNVWLSAIPKDPNTAVSNQLAVKIVADLKKIQTSLFNSRFLSYEAVWGATPSGKDPKTNQNFEYGKGSLKNINIGDRILQIIPSSYGDKYEILPYNGTAHPNNLIPIFDAREWVYQYGAGIFYQSNVNISPYTEPKCLEGYYYLGDKLSSFDTVAPEIIRVTSASGPDVNGIYFATQSDPFISTYSNNHLYLIDFIIGNTTSVKLNIDFLGSYSVYRWGSTGLGELLPGDIIGATGSTAGPSYYLTWNTDGYFEFFNSRPTQVAGLFKNETLVANPVGGIYPNLSFNDVTFQDMFSNLIYPEQNANFTQFSLSHPRVSTSSSPDFSFIDIGRTFSGTLTFSWNYFNGPLMSPSVNIDDTTPTGVPGSTTWPAQRTNPVSFVISSMTGTFSYTQSVVSTVPDKRVFTLKATRTNNTTVRRLHEIIWTWRGYYGSSTFSVLNNIGVTALPSSLMTSSIGTLTIGGNQGYKYMAFPDTSNYNFKSITYFGLPVLLATNSYTSVDNFGNNYRTLTVTNSFGVGTTYRLYRTLNQISGTISVNINN